MIYIYFGDLDRALKFIFLRKYINQSFRESLWKFTDFLPCGKSYFSLKLIYAVPILIKVFPAWLIGRLSFVSRGIPLLCFIFTLDRIVCARLAHENDNRRFFPTSNFAWKWIRYGRKIKRGFRVCSRLKKTEVAFYWLHLHYSISSIEVWYFKSMEIVNLTEKIEEEILFLTIYRQNFYNFYIFTDVIYISFFWIFFSISRFFRNQSSKIICKIYEKRCFKKYNNDPLANQCIYISFFNDTRRIWNRSRELFHDKSVEIPRRLCVNHNVRGPCSPLLFQVD